MESLAVLEQDFRFDFDDLLLGELVVLDSQALGISHDQREAAIDNQPDDDDAEEALREVLREITLLGEVALIMEAARDLENQPCIDDHFTGFEEEAAASQARTLGHGPDDGHGHGASGKSARAVVHNRKGKEKSGAGKQPRRGLVWFLLNYQSPPSPFASVARRP